MLKLKEAINFAYAKGLIIIAACSNRNIITYPSSFSNVIGVSSDKRLNLAGNQYLYNINALNGIEIVAAGAHELTNFRGIKEVIVPANSYAAPLITALVYNILDKDQKLSMEQIKEQLAYSAIAENKETYSIVNRRINLDWVINSIIINLGMKDGILEEILYPFNVYEIINMTSTKLDTINKEIKAYSKLHKKALETIDTIIIIDNISITNSSIEQIFNCFSEKHIVYIPNNNTELQYNLAEVIDNSHKNIWYPYSITDIGLDRGINIEVPVILINNFGDINSLKLISQLRKRFENDGYEVTAISDMYLGCISSMYYVPSNGVNVDKLEPIIREINRLNNPDVLIVSINIGNELKGLNELLEPDVNILMKSDKDYLKNLIDLESRNNVIINDENGQEPVPSKHIAYFRSDEIDEIYEYLIRLYY